MNSTHFMASSLSLNRSFFIKIFCWSLGLLLRLAYCIKYPVQPRDSYEYKYLIEQWEQFGEIVDATTFFPLSLWFLKIPNHYFDYDIFKGGIIINNLLGLLMIVIAINTLSLFFKNMYTVFVSGIIIATHPTLIVFSCTFLRENTYLFLSFLMLSFFARYCIWNRLFDLIAFSLFAALAFLCRLEGLEMLVILPIAITFVLIPPKKISRTAFHLFVFFIIFFTISITVCRLHGYRFVTFGDILKRFHFTTI